MTVTASKYQIAIDELRKGHRVGNTVHHIIGAEYEDSICLDRVIEGADDAFECAVHLLKKNLPNWWYRVGDCKVSADATIAPELGGVDFEFEAGSVWDDGFMFDGRYDTDHQPSCAKSLLIVMLMALEALEAKQ